MATAAPTSNCAALPVFRHEQEGVTVEIGGIPIRLRVESPNFCRLIEKRYADFLNPLVATQCHFDIQLKPRSEPSDQPAQVERHGSEWSLERGDFHARWDARTRRGWIRQSANPYSLDTLLRIVHSLVLADEGGFLVHAASAVRNGRAFLFAGVSGAGKTTMARFAPPDVTVLTDEISYLRPNGPDGNGYLAYGTPFAGELARVGANLSAPVETIFLLEQGSENRIEPVGSVAATQALLRHILFFARDPDMVTKVFASAMALVSRVTVKKLVFRREARAWDLVR